MTSANTISEKIKTVVIDAGGRYGLHPSWKSFSGEMNYHLFEPDPTESDRLEKKYKARSNEITVVNSALAEHNGKITLNLFRNKAMSSSNIRNPVSALFNVGSEREKEVEILETLELDALSIDSYCESTGSSVDFLKLDTEGSEFSILLGAQGQIKNNILGVRCEVSFDYIFDKMPLFGTLHEFMLGHNFVLLNLDYNGRGDYQNNFVNTDKPYGILTATDAVWIKRPQAIFNSLADDDNAVTIRVMKYAAFCLLNNAPDVALSIMWEARKIHNLNFNNYQASNLFNFLFVAVHRHFYSLKWQPGQSLREHEQMFKAIFELPMRVLNDFMESEQLNPD